MALGESKIIFLIYSCVAGESVVIVGFIQGAWPKGQSIMFSENLRTKLIVIYRFQGDMFR